jgi:hypothetical protein
MRITALFIFSCLLVFFSVHLRADADPEVSYTISGHIKDAKNGEELIGAAVMVREYQKGTVTNVYGFYSVSLAAGNYVLVFSYVGYEPVEIPVTLDRDLTINIELTEQIRQLDEVTISSEGRNAHLERAEMSVNKLPIKSIRRIPSLMGEVDVIKAIQLLPGVHASSEGSSGFSVRGGNPDQNLILLDEAVVYNASHMLGFFSVFNNDAVKDVKLYKGDIPAEYGGRISSLLDVRMKDGNNKKFSGAGGIGTISSRLTLEGPIIKDRTSFILSARRTYADLFLPLANDEVLRKSKLYFYDLNAKVNHIFNDKNRIFLSGYAGNDVFRNQYAGMKFGNRTFTTRWNHLFSPRIFSNTSLVLSNYNYQISTPEGDVNSFQWISRMNDVNGKIDLNYFLNPDVTLRFGISSIFHTFKPGSAEGLGEESFFTEITLPDSHALENGIYLSAEQNAGSRWKLKYGLRISTFHSIGKAWVYHYDDDYVLYDSTFYGKGDFYNSFLSAEPRLAMTFMLDSSSSVKASYSRTTQFVHLAQNSTAGTPLDIWFPSSPNVRPQLCVQVALGYFRNFLGDQVESSVEIYYKKINHAIDFKDHANLLLNKYLEGELRFGRAEAIGMEFLIRKNEGRLNGWISYTLSKTIRDIEEINHGNPYPAPYDRPHNVSVVMNYEISQRIWTSANWVYGTGLPVTFPTGRFEYMGNIAPVYSDRNSYRMPDYHRLDISISLQSKSEPERKWNYDLNLSVYNAYARKNAWAINFVQDDEDPNITYAEMTYLFSIVPALTFNFNF